ncbi:hypothetical protein V6N13_129436 [Hibiscus sabdariffa]
MTADALLQNIDLMGGNLITAWIDYKNGLRVLNSTKEHHNRLGLGLGIAGLVFFFVVLAVFGYVSPKKWKDARVEKCLKAEILTGPSEFSYRELCGAFGNVYKAVFVSSGAVGVVKRSKHSDKGKTEFLAELFIIAGLRHKNLVQLQGWCAEMGELLLVYEFMPNGSLEIRDIKTSNIMLDDNFNPRLGDFGYARLMDHDKSPVSTVTAGTMGYLAPEYLQYRQATEKTDVFSFGIVILEVACGRRPIEREVNSQKMENLVDWVWGVHGEGRIIEAADKRLNGAFGEEEMRKLLLVGLSCAHPDSAERPSIRRVLQILNNEVDPIAVPKMKPSLVFSCNLTVEDIVSDGEESKTTA